MGRHNVLPRPSELPPIPSAAHSVLGQQHSIGVENSKRMPGCQRAIADGTLSATRNDRMSTPAATPNQPRPGLEKWVKRLSFIAMIGMFIVLMMGSTVTNTGSGEGCGRSWPLCQGEFIPEYAIETAIEFSHRIVTAIEGVLIFAVSIGAILIRRGNRQV